MRGNAGEVCNGIRMTTKIATRFPIPYEKIEAFCRKWNIIRFELFGSILRDDFDSNRSDVDVLVIFAPGANTRARVFQCGGGTRADTWPPGGNDNATNGGAKRQLDSARGD